MKSNKLPWVDISDKLKSFHKCYECVVMVNDIKNTFTAFIDMVYDDSGEILEPVDKTTGFVSNEFGMAWDSFDTVEEAKQYCQNIYNDML